MDIDTESGELELEQVSIEDSYRTRVQCISCGYILKDKNKENITDDDEVMKWIIEHPAPNGK
jgi:hypothetical protein